MGKEEWCQNHRAEFQRGVNQEWAQVEQVVEQGVGQRGAVQPPVQKEPIEASAGLEAQLLVQYK